MKYKSPNKVKYHSLLQFMFRFFPAITRNAKVIAYHGVYAMQFNAYKSSSTGITKACCTHSPFVPMPSSS